MTKISAYEILNIKETELKQYKLHIATKNEFGQEPLSVFLENWEIWKGWNQWRKERDDFSRPKIFSLIRFHHEPHKWLFGGIFNVIDRHDNYKDTEVGYTVELDNLHKELIGRLIIHFNRSVANAKRGRAFYLENYYKDFEVAEILKNKYDGISFPGYENVNIDFPELETIIRFQKNDWRGALENIKGVYAIFDKSNGRKYVGSAYGEFGIWSRWSTYAGNGHGFNNELTRLIKKEGIQYARKNFRICLLEYRPAKTDDSIIIGRENFWKEALISRTQFGYNKN